MLSRYKGPGSKEKIRKCIERKGRKLGCTGATKDTVQDEPSPGAGAEPAVATAEDLQRAFGTPAEVVDGMRALARYTGDEDTAEIRDVLLQQGVALDMADAAGMAELLTLIDLLESYSTYMRAVDY